MAYYEYTSTSPPYWLDHYVDDSRITVGAYTYFNAHITFGLWNPEEQIQIGRFCSLAKNITIFGGGEHFTRRATTYPFVVFFAETRSERVVDGKTKGATVIGNDVWIGYEATVMSGVKIGNGAVIGAKAVVAKDMPDYAIAVGNPAQVVRYRFPPKTIERLLALRWWDWELPKILANLDLLYQNPELWADNLQFREPETDSPICLSAQQLFLWGITENS